jgi:hypothetical protein
MEFLGLLAVGLLFSIPVMAIIALVRTGTMRRILDEATGASRRGGRGLLNSRPRTGLTSKRRRKGQRDNEPSYHLVSV